MSEVLTLEKQEIDPEENLSEYGFDSIMLAEFAAKIVRLYPFMKLKPSTFLELPTLSKLASFLGAKYKTELLHATETASFHEQLAGDRKLSTGTTSRLKSSRKKLVRIMCLKRLRHLYNTWKERRAILPLLEWPAGFPVLRTLVNCGRAW